MRILQLGKFYPPDIGGIETVMFDITEELNKRGIKCDVLCSNNKNEYKEEVLNNYKIYRAISYGRLSSTSIAPQMIFKLKEIINRYDIIHIHHPDPMANLALFIANPKKQKIIVHWHSDIIKQKIFLHFYKPFLYLLLQKADAIIATTSDYIEGSAFLSEFKNKVKTIPIGINLNNLKCAEQNVNELKEKYKSKKIIFSLGRFIYYKGFQYLIKAAKYLDDNYVILIGGDGKLKDGFLNLIKIENLYNKVKLLGKIPEDKLSSYYKACDIFCLPSIERSEAFGLVMVEAMSFGKPIVSTVIPYSGVSWVNRDNYTGLNVEPKNPVALADSFKAILENNKSYQKFSLNAIKRFNEEFTIEKEVSRFIELYTNLLN